MKLLGYEYMKLFNKRMLILLVPLFLIINSYMYYQEQLREHGDFLLVRQAYDKIERQFRSLSFEEGYEQARTKQQELQAFRLLKWAAADQGNLDIQKQAEELKANNPGIVENYNHSPYFRSPEMLVRDSMIYFNLFEQYAAIEGQKIFVNDLDKKAAQLLSVSIFQNKGSFAYRNILKTPEDFARVKQLPMRIGLETGLTSAANFRITDLFMVVVITLLCIYIFQYEKETQMSRLLRASMLGRLPLAIVKCTTLALTTVLVAAVYYGSILAIADHLYGFGELSRYIQSMAAFKHSSIPITVGQYLALYMSGKIAVCLAVAMLWSTVFTFMNHAGKIFFALIVFLGISYLCFWYIHPLSTWNLLKYINLFSYYNVHGWLAEYKNINLAGYPFAYHILFAISLPVVMFGLIGLSIINLIRYETPDKVFFLSFVWHRVKQKLWKPWYLSGLYAQELRKSLLTGKSIWIFFIAGAIAYQDVRVGELRFGEDDANYNRYMETWSGPWTATKSEQIEAENKRFDDLPIAFARLEQEYAAGSVTTRNYWQQVNEWNTFLLKKKAFDRVYRQYEQLHELKRLRGINGWFVNEISSGYLFQNTNRDLINSLVFSGLLLLVISSVYSIDYKAGVIPIILCSRNGRRRIFVVKTILSVCMAIVLLLIVYLPVYWNLLAYYNPLEWHAPLQSLQMYKDIRLPVTLGQFVFLIALGHMAGGSAMALCVLYISILARKQALTIWVAAALFILPILLQGAGMSFVRNYSFNLTFHLYTVFSEISGQAEIMLMIYYFVIVTGVFLLHKLAWNTYLNRSWSLRRTQYDSLHSECVKEI